MILEVFSNLIDSVILSFQGQQSDLFRVVTGMTARWHEPDHTGLLLPQRHFLGVCPLHPQDCILNSELPKASSVHKTQTSSGS